MEKPTKAGVRVVDDKVCAVCRTPLSQSWDYKWNPEWGSRPAGPGGKAPLCLEETWCDKCGLLYTAGGGVDP